MEAANNCELKEENSTEITVRENGHSANISATEIGGDDIENKLRGDAIGDSMYSQSFVVKTLLKLSDLKWDKDTEEDLCSLWDMTVEKDVCAYLFDLSYPSLACSVIQNSDENRLIEIIIGILANIFCADCAKSISDVERETALEVLSSDDPLVLIQVVRLIKALSHLDEQLNFVTSDILNKFSFILLNSLNVDLICNSLDALSTVLANDNFDKQLLTPELLNASLVAYQSISCVDEDAYFFESSVHQTSFTHLMTLVTCFTSYIDTSSGKYLLEEIEEYKTSLRIEIIKVLKFYSDQENLIPISDKFKFYVESFSYCFPILSIDYESALFINILDIILILIKNDSLDTGDFSDLVCYLICKADINQLKIDSEKLSANDMMLVLKTFQKHLDMYDNEKCQQLLHYFSNR